MQKLANISFFESVCNDGLSNDITVFNDGYEGTNILIDSYTEKELCKELNTILEYVNETQGGIDDLLNILDELSDGKNNFNRLLGEKLGENPDPELERAWNSLSFDLAHIIRKIRGLEFSPLDLIPKNILRINDIIFEENAEHPGFNRGNLPGRSLLD